MRKLSFPLIYSDGYVLDLGQHVFPARKFRLVRERLVAEGIAAEEDFVTPAPIADGDVARVHERGYLERMLEGRLNEEERVRLELPFDESLRLAFWLATGGTLAACGEALSRQCAINLSGGFHHAFAGHGEGFCLINDVAIAVEATRAEGAIDRALLVDLDVHQGNGSAAIFAEVPSVFTFSMHQLNNYPAAKPESDLDIGLPDGASNELYLTTLQHHLPEVLDAHRPELVVYLAGADPYREDRLGGLGLTVAGLEQRDRFVFAEARRRQMPVAVVLAGGYARDTEDTVKIHLGTVRAARDVFSSV